MRFPGLSSGYFILCESVSAFPDIANPNQAGEERGSHEPTARITRTEKLFLADGENKDTTNIPDIDDSQTLSSKSIPKDRDDADLASPDAEHRQRKADRPNLAIDRIAHNSGISLPARPLDHYSSNCSPDNNKSGITFGDFGSLDAA